MIINNIKYINPPKPGGKYGSIKGADGTTIMVPPDLLQGFRLGMTCEVNTKVQTWNVGTPDEGPRTIATSGPLPPYTRAVQDQGVQAGYQSANQAPANYRSNTGFRPRVIQGGPVGTNPQSDHAKDLHIFVTGVVQQAMSSGKFTASEIPVLTLAAVEAYRHLGGKPVEPAAPPPDHPSVPGFEPGDPGPDLQ